MKSAAIFFLFLLPAWAWADTMTETKNLALSSEGIDTLVVNCGAGSFNIRGASGKGKIKITAEIEVDEPGQINFEEFLQTNVQLSLEKQGNKAILQSDIIKAATLQIEARINLQIEVPQKINVKIRDGSGPIRVNQLDANVDIDDDSGSIKIKNIVGKVSIADSSGSIKIEDIKGNVFVTDGSGSIAIESVEGDLNIKDGSGILKVVDIDGNVTVSDSSGSIEIHDVKENVFIVIREEGSGIVELEGVKGKVTIRP
jgi:DUF4097 and DUF4098 domain-containing protein YvlB